MVSFRALWIFAAGAVLLTSVPAHAQGFFNSWFGNGQREQSSERIEQVVAVLQELHPGVRIVAQKNQ